MVDLIPPQTVLTTASATNDFQSFGLEALGLTAPALSPVWASATPTQYAQDALTVQLQDTRAPFYGIATWESTPSAFSDPTGAALSGPALVLRLHPEAARRLQIEIDLRLGSNIYPTPVAVVLRGLTPPATLPPPQIYLASQSLEPGGLATVSFHDARGLPIDPIAMAHLWNDLIQWRPALQNTKQIPGNPAPMDAGGVGNMLGLQSGVIVHVIDPHGWRYASQRPQAKLHILGTNGAEAAAFPASSVLKLDSGQTLGRTAPEQISDQAAGWAPLRWGFARNGTLGATSLAMPVLPVGVCRFVRVMAVDLDGHLLGNRTTADVLDNIAGKVTKEDGATPSFLVPRVRDPVPGFGWLSSASDVLGAMAAAAQGMGQPGNQHLAIAVSPAIDPAMTTPPAPGAEWPAFPPPPAGAGEISSTADPRAGIKANWRNPADGPTAKQDVVLTLDGAQLPLGAHVRAYPRSFVEIQSIGAQASFVRGDGGAAIATAGEVTLLLVNPFGLGADEPHPATQLIVDLVVVSRSNKRRIYSAVRIDVDAAVKSPTDSGFQGTALLAPGSFLAATLDGLKTRAVAPLPLFGLPRPPGSALPANPTLKDLLTRLATDEQPRQGPRLPTQARFESAFVVATIATAQPAPVWQAVVSGVRFTSESRNARPDLANPGNPASPDVFAAGIACRGRLAYDIAIHALKRAQPIFVPDTPTSFHGWIATLMDARWNPVADTTGTVAGAALETIAAFCDTPELAAAPVPAPGATVQSLVNAIASDIGVPPPTVSTGNEKVVVPIVQREIATARSGQRDALWSLNRAFSQAREFIYIESPGFGRTARPPPSPQPYQLDLAAVIATKMAANPRLKLIVCVPREGDFDRSRAPWTVTALANRKQLLDDLIGVDPKRVAAFHPFGFPGRAPAIRTTTVIVDDVYCLSGTSHFRRRGMTFDGALDIANFDRALTEGYSKGIADFRRRLLAEKLGLVNATTVAAATALWLRLGSPEGMFDVVRELLAEGGAGRLQPVWTGPKADGLLPKDDKFVDPDGVDGDAFLGLFASMLVED